MWKMRGQRRQTNKQNTLAFYIRVVSSTTKEMLNADYVCWLFIHLKSGIFEMPKKKGKF